MIQIGEVDYDHLTDIGIQITKYVNRNLQDIIRVLLDILATDPDFDLDGFFPRDYLRRKPQECRNAVSELYEIICSKNIRDYIKPKYEYLLYTILSWWQDCADSEEDLITNEVSDELKSALDTEEGKGVLERIQDYEEYYNICFQDHDFLPGQLSNMVMLYLQKPQVLEAFFQYDNLDDFVDLMDVDLRERYLEARSQKEDVEDVPIEEKIVGEFLSVLKLFQKRIVQFEKRDEVEITADLQDAVGEILNNKYGVHIAREFTMGRACKKLGETDLYIYEETEGQIVDYAVLENKYIENFTNQYYQLMGYLNHNFKFGITLSINRKKSLKDGINEIENKLQAMDGKFAPVDIKKVGSGGNIFLVSEHVVPETGESMKVFHLIFQLYDQERKDAAALARK